MRFLLFSGTRWSKFIAHGLGVTCSSMVPFTGEWPIEIQGLVHTDMHLPSPNICLYVSSNMSPH
jgi:hypothetical protein